MNPTYKGSIESLKDFWENRSKTFERDYSIRSEGISRIARRISRLIEARLVLDIGCGPGIQASLYPNSTNVIGFDFSISMLKSAQKRISSLVLGDSHNLPFCNEVFEVATCLFVASDYSVKNRIFSEAYRVLEKNGLFLFADYSPRDEHWKFRMKIRPIIGESCNMHIEDARTLSNELKLTGFKVQKAEYIRFDAEFLVERYLKSDFETEMLKKFSPRLQERLEHCAQSGKIRREFLLLISSK